MKDSSPNAGNSLSSSEWVEIEKVDEFIEPHQGVSCFELVGFYF